MDATPQTTRRPPPRLWVILLTLGPFAAILASIAIPNQLGSSRVAANAMAAVATLRNIHSAQHQIREAGAIDVDGDGRGEFGYFAELAGGVALRGRERRLDPPVLSGAFANVAESVITRSGYLFQLYLPGRNAVALPEADMGGVGTTPPDPNAAEQAWCCYAWPSGDYGQSRVFFVNQAGVVLEIESNDHLGREHPPDARAAFRKGSRRGLLGPIADGTKGQDGQAWTRVH